MLYCSKIYNFVIIYFELFFLVCINIRLERINIFVFIFYFNNIEFCFFLYF